MWFLSGALFPPSGAAGVIRAVMMINPLTYGMEGLRRAIYWGDPQITSSMPGFGVCLGISVAFAIALFLLASTIAQKRVAADVQEMLVDGVAVLIGQPRKSGRTRQNRRQRHRHHIRSRKAGHGQSAGDHRHRAAFVGNSGGNAACPRQVPDAQQVLDVEEDTRRFHADLCHSSSKSLVSVRMLAV